MVVTLMPSVKILLDLTLVPAKRVLQEMEKHALVRFTLLTDFFFQIQNEWSQCSDILLFPRTYVTLNIILLFA